MYPTGKKSYVLAYRNKGGRARIITLGRHGVLTPVQAREKAVQALSEVNRGIDPLEDRRSARSGDTVRSFAAVYMEQHAKRRKKTWREDQRRLDTYVLPASVQGHGASPEPRH